MKPLIALLLALALLAPVRAAPIPPQPYGLPGVDGPGSVVIQWTVHSDATGIVAAIRRPDGSGQPLTVLREREPELGEAPPTWQGRTIRLYLPSWEPGDVLVVKEERRYWNRLVWVEEWTYPIRWRVYVPHVEAP